MGPLSHRYGQLLVILRTAATSAGLRTLEQPFASRVKAWERPEGGAVMVTTKIAPGSASWVLMVHANILPACIATAAGQFNTASETAPGPHLT